MQMQMVKLWLAMVLAGAGAVALFRSERMRQPESAPTAASQPALAATSSNEPVPVNGGAPMTVPVMLTVSGEVVGLPASATAPTVTVRVGTVDVPATVTNRSFTANTPYSGADAMVTVTARSGDVQFRSVVGTMRRLKRLSGGDGRVVPAEAPALKVGAWSSAIAATSRLLLGREAVDDAELERASTRIHGVDMAWIAYLLDQYASGAFVLPAGFATGYEVVLDNQALRREIESRGAVGSWSAALHAFVAAQPPLAPIGTLDALPDTLLARAAIVEGELPFNSAVWMLRRGTGSRFDLYEPVASTEPRTAAQVLSDGTIELVPVAARSSLRQETTPFSGVPVTILRTVDAIRWRRISDGDRVDLWSIATHWTETYPDFPSQPPVAGTTSNVLAAEDFAGLVRANAWNGSDTRRRTFPTTCIRPVLGHPAMEICDTAIHRLDPGGTGMTEDVGLKVSDRMTPQPGVYGSAFNWSYGNGRLVLQYPNARTEAWAVDGVSGVDSIVYLTTRTADGKTYSATGATLSIVASTVPFSASQAAGTWTSGLVRVFASNIPRVDSAFAFVRNDGGTGEHQDGYDGETFRILQTWTIQGERVYDIRVRARSANGASSYVTDCASAFAAGATACAPWRLRYLRPLRRIGNRLYGIEEVHSQIAFKPQGDTGPYENIQISTRANYQECTAGACLAFGSAPPLPEYARPSVVASVQAGSAAAPLPPLRVAPRERLRRRL